MISKEKLGVDTEAPNVKDSVDNVLGNTIYSNNSKFVEITGFNSPDSKL